MAFVGILFLIFVDWKLTPGDSFARISKSAVGTAIALATIACFFFVGIACCYQVLVFALGSRLVSSQNMGICIAFLNSINIYTRDNSTHGVTIVEVEEGIY
jgi:hypothetical protein